MVLVIDSRGRDQREWLSQRTSRFVAMVGVKNMVREYIRLGSQVN